MLAATAKALSPGSVSVRSFLLIIGFLFFTASCSRPDFDTAIQVEAWLESLDGNAKVIEVGCTASVEQPPGSGTWKPFDFKHQFSAADVLDTSMSRGLDWGAIVARMAKMTEVGFPGYVALELGVSASQEVRFKMSFRFKDLRCDGKPLRSPSIRIGLCPNDTHGCSAPATPTDQPPPQPPPGGGGDF